MHRAEQIIDAIVATLRADATLAASVYKHLAVTLAEAETELPAVSVGMGVDEPLGEIGVTNVAYIDSLLAVPILLVCQADTEALAITELMRLRAEVHRTMMAGQRDHGLTTIVIDTRYAGADAPQLNTEGSRITGRLETRWLVHYRMNITDPET